MLRISLFLLMCLLPGILFAQLWSDTFLFASSGPFYTIDYDQDGDLDILRLSSGVYVHENRLPDDWIPSLNSIPEFWSTDSEPGDVESDGDLDWIYYAGGVTYGAIGWLENLGNWEFEVHVISELEDGSNRTMISGGDIDNDGDIDIVLTQTSTGSASYGMSIWTQENNGTFTETIIGDSLMYKNLSRLADLNDDGNLDFIINQAHPWLGMIGLSVALGDGEGGFTMQVIIPDLHDTFASEPKLGDFDFDGDLDFVFYHDENQHYGEKVLWGENDGAGNFTVHVVENNLDPSRKAVEMLDCDNDGDMDIAYGPLLFINEGDNLTFTETLYTDIDPGYIFDHLVAADIDNDGDTDLLNEEVRWFENPTIDLAVDEEQDGSSLPSEFALHPAYPNPFNASTTLHLALPHPAEVTVRVYNVMGQHVATIADGSMPAGVHPLTLDASTLTSGIYFIHASAPSGLDQMQKVMLVR
ncbi:hypothetical protein BMS3Bbin04_01271 [bacterium BMS3Bbin04]|nr:hypothetical protein BMS3Bbin04_01271 [bacterium BMS3Bbin04]